MDIANPNNYMEVPTPSTGNNEYFNFTPSGNHRGICPEGWHVPADTEWNTMEKEVSGTAWQTSFETTANYRGTHAGKLSTGCDWAGNANTLKAPNNYSYDERNSSGFAAVPAGGFSTNGFSSISEIANFWSSSPNTYNAYVWSRSLQRGLEGVSRGQYNEPKSGRSVRCVRD